MKPQNYGNHIRFYPPYHFVLLPLQAAAIVFSVYSFFHNPFQQVFYLWITVVLLLLFCTTVMMRQHYALGNQNRIVRLEMRLRYYQLTGQSFAALEQQLTFGQIAALRFASDKELPALASRAAKEKMSPKEIKQSVTDWQGDYMRV